MFMHSSRLYADGLETTAARNALFDEDAGHVTPTWHFSEASHGLGRRLAAGADRLPR